jgi:hypothetical protein
MWSASLSFQLVFPALLGAKLVAGTMIAKDHPNGNPFHLQTKQKRLKLVMTLSITIRDDNSCCHLQNYRSLLVHKREKVPNSTYSTTSSPDSVFNTTEFTASATFSPDDALPLPVRRRPRIKMDNQRSVLPVTTAFAVDTPWSSPVRDRADLQIVQQPETVREVPTTESATSSARHNQPSGSPTTH